MIVLGIESSCDETAAAIVEDGTRLLSTVVASQIDIHAAYGGVIPEVAARSHLEVMLPVIQQSLDEAGLTWGEIDAIAVTYAPGLVGSLLIGTLAARTLALIKHKPLYPVHHVEGHVYANFIDARTQAAESQTSKGASEPTSADRTGNSLARDFAFPAKRGKTNSQLAPSESRAKDVAGLVGSSSTTPTFPLLALIVSGGHSQLALFKGHGDFRLLGQTQDDAVGEAFDKVAKIIGLPYPGGPSITQAAHRGNPHAFPFPKARMQNKYDFSFSGLKTAVLRTVQTEVGVDYTFPSHRLAERVNLQLQADIAASFQYVAVETLVDKTVQAVADHSPASVVIAGGVAANSELRRQLRERLPISIDYAPINLCTDNAAMIASLGYFYAQANRPTDPRALEVAPSLSMTKTAWAPTI
ncbi:MAG TPA: tRNA (adenosine(37)-N6)-threonylcarbamoyltransferase complex transferase subunit TsaD [Candidatus Saccharimonadales bacterium]|jgi:N6-L-threonylcarbamoyladenine synthase